MRRNRSFTTSAVAAAAVLALSPVAGAQRETRERTILASVVDSHDAPVTDLTVKDFIVRENGIAREVTRVAPGQGPTHVAILLDDSQATRDTTTFLRPAVSGFIKQMAAAATPPQMALWTFGERPTRRAVFSSNAVAIE